MSWSWDLTAGARQLSSKPSQVLQHPQMKLFGIRIHRVSGVLKSYGLEKELLHPLVLGGVELHNRPGANPKKPPRIRVPSSFKGTFKYIIGYFKGLGFEGYKPDSAGLTVTSRKTNPGPKDSRVYTV